MRTLYFNCSAGISGDMTAGALLNFVNEKKFRSELSKLNLGGYKLKIRKVRKKGIRALKFGVIAKRETEGRNLREILGIIDGSPIKKGAKELARKIFLNLAKAEAKAHKTGINELHFHEVGAIDSIVDIVGAAILLNMLKPDKIYCGRISVGRGKIRSAHGIMKQPAPAVKELLKNVPMEVLNVKEELVTPTGAAIITTIADEFEDDFEPEGKKGYGAGTWELPFPNVLEVTMGNEKGAKNEKALVLETNIDDMNPQFYEYAIGKLIERGAKDAFIQPVIMKKSRIGTLLTVICDKRTKERMIETIFDETTTFGIRISEVSRVVLERKMGKVKTRFGKISVKIGSWKGKVKTISSEYEECKKAAIGKKVPLRRVYGEAENAARKPL